MSLEKELQERSGNVCESCGSTDNLQVHTVSPKNDLNADHSIYACGTCVDQINNPDNTDPNHWRCLNDSMWSQVPAMQVVAWRMLTRLKGEGWPVDLLDMMYMEDDVKAWAKDSEDGMDEGEKIVHRDSVGAILSPGDSVVLIKDLNVKGSSMVAKRGTAVRNITLDRENANYIEGKVNGQTIVIITEYVKKS